MRNWEIVFCIIFTAGNGHAICVMFFLSNFMKVINKFYGFIVEFVFNVDALVKMSDVENLIDTKTRCCVYFNDGLLRLFFGFDGCFFFLSPLCNN